ncbi:AAA family ATPase [Mycena chlorophos]|uniref:AAA family ATPase n=1 Tax=Mycena chlorophos TaxID=658473 RepID=A0A8H6VXB6_MYCCL|nr:AAA family ATPase [Mycena chlorophos]
MSTSGKGKGREQAPLPGPSSGSANPAASLSALWAYLLPALTHIMKSPQNDASATAKAPAIDMAFYSGIHTACYNYFTSQNENHFPPTSAARAMGTTDRDTQSGNDLYEQLDKFFLETAREVMLGLPQDDDTELVDYIVPCFNRYSAGATSVNRLLNYINRHYVRRAVEEDRGWLRVSDIVDLPAGTTAATLATTATALSMSREDAESREKLARLLKEKRVVELRKWGYDGSAQSPMGAAEAEASAEAASAPDRIVSVVSLAHRRFRTEVLEPLLAVPVIKGHKPKKKIPKAATGPPPSIPKGRLARSVRNLLESKGGDEEEKARLAADLLRALRLSGIRTDHPLRKRLDKFVTTGG